ncbi:MAG TPA: glycosyltransferase family 39 protein, partial [Blastocatellia bacterium]|nr:glycosyltransferase family 39 protein [Blastocatellia bacterium]
MEEPRANEPAIGKRIALWSETLPFLIAIIAACICYALFFRRGAWLSVIGYSVSPAERVLYGEVPYRDFLYNYTPGILWLNALLMWLFGAGVLTINAGLFVVKLLTVAALYYAGRRLTSSWAALAPVGLALAWIGYRYVFGVFPTQYSMLFILLGLVCMLRYDETEKIIWLLLSGCLIGMVFVFKYNVGILLLATGTAAVVIRELALSSGPILARVIPVLKRCGVFWAGFAIVAGAMALYLAYNDALGPMADHFLNHVLAYGQERAIPLPPIKHLGPSLLALVLLAAAALVVLLLAPRYYQAFLVIAVLICSVALLIPGRAYYLKQSAIAFASYMPILLFTLVAAWLVWRLRSELKKNRTLEDWWAGARTLTIVGLIASGTFLEIYPRADLYHIVRVLPPVFLLLLVVFGKSWPLVDSFISTREKAGRRATLLTFASPVMILA